MSCQRLFERLNGLSHPIALVPVLLLAWSRRTVKWEMPAYRSMSMGTDTRPAAILVLFLAFASPTGAQVILDQEQQTAREVGFNAQASNVEFQQEVVAGVDGTLAGVELFFGFNPSHELLTFVTYVNLGAPWQSDAHDFETVVETTASLAFIFVDVSSAAIQLQVGDRFVIGIKGTDQHMSVIIEGANSDAYSAGSLFLDTPNIDPQPQPTDLAFRTYMDLGPAVYDFEGLTVGADIAGQDGWYVGFASGSAFIANGSTSVNSTQVATIIGAGAAQGLARQNDNFFAFSAFTGNETEAFIQCDLRWDRPEDGNGVRFAIGTDLDGNGQLTFGNFLRESVAIRLQNGRFGFDNDNIGPGALRTTIGAGDIGDWYRLRLVMDFTGSAGGIGTLLYKNLTRGDTAFSTVVSGSLELDLMAPGAEVQNWNTIAITVNQGSEFDNLTISTPLVAGDTIPPTANTGPNQAIHASQVVDLDGSESFDDTTALEDLEFEWAFSLKPDGSAAALSGANTSMPSFLADIPGEYRVQLTVTDEAGNASAPAEVIVSSLNVAPTADAGIDHVVIIDNPATLDGLGSSDPEGDPLTYLWAIIASPTDSGSMLVDDTTPTPSLTPDLLGRYVVRLIVNDGFEDSLAAIVNVVAITGEKAAENEVSEANDQVLSLSKTSFDASGHQKSICKELAKITSFIQQSDNEQAIKHLKKSIARTDGVALRGEPDPKGGGQEYEADFVTDCEAQLALYQTLNEAMNALQ